MARYQKINTKACRKPGIETRWLTGPQNTTVLAANKAKTTENRRSLKHLGPQW